jgi:hypothetical protein
LFAISWIEQGRWRNERQYTGKRRLTGISTFIAGVIWWTGITLVIRTGTAAAGIITIAKDVVITGGRVVGPNTT